MPQSTFVIIIEAILRSQTMLRPPSLHPSLSVRQIAASRGSQVARHSRGWQPSSDPPQATPPAVSRLSLTIDGGGRPLANRLQA